MQVDINYTQILSYLLGIGGAYVLGQPLVMKAISWVKGLKKPSILSKVEELNYDPEPTHDDSFDVAVDLLNAAFMFKFNENQNGVQRCLDALAELTSVPAKSQPQNLVREDSNQ